MIILIFTSALLCKVEDIPIIKYYIQNSSKWMGHMVVYCSLNPMVCLCSANFMWLSNITRSLWEPGCFSAAHSPAATGHLPLALYSATCRAESGKGLGRGWYCNHSKNNSHEHDCEPEEPETSWDISGIESTPAFFFLPISLTISFTVSEKYIYFSNRLYFQGTVPFLRFTFISKWSSFSFQL